MDNCRFYKECPHPDEKQRKELSLQLGIEPIQVKFWFQNKRTQMKVYIYKPVLLFSINQLDFLTCSIWFI